MGVLIGPGVVKALLRECPDCRVFPGLILYPARRSPSATAALVGVGVVPRKEPRRSPSKSILGD
jgi:hypothetical protein